MSDSAKKLQAVFDAPDERTMYAEMIGSFDTLHYQLREISSPEQDCVKYIRNLNERSHTFRTPKLSTSYLGVAENGRKVKAASALVARHLATACFVEWPLMEDTYALCNLLRENLCGLKQVVPDEDNPRWKDINDTMHYIESEIYDELARVIRCAELDVEECSPQQVKALASDLRHLVESQLDADMEQMKRTFENACRYDFCGNVEAAIEHFRNQLDMEFLDNPFVHYCRQRVHSYQDLARYLRRNARGNNTEEAVAFVRYLARKRFLDSRNEGPVPTMDDRGMMVACVVRVVQSNWWSQLPERSPVEPTKNRVMALLGCMLYRKGLLPKYGSNGFSLESWGDLLVNELHVEGVSSKNMRYHLQPYREDLGKGRFDSLVADHGDLWQKLCDLLEDVD